MASHGGALGSAVGHCFAGQQGECLRLSFVRCLRLLFVRLSVGGPTGKTNRLVREVYVFVKESSQRKTQEISPFVRRRQGATMKGGRTGT